MTEQAACRPSTAPAQPATPVWRPWATVAMLFTVQIINRADKAVLGLAAGAVMVDLQITPERFGFIASSFYFLYALGGIAVGYFFAHRYPPRVILAVLIGVWSLSQLPIIVAASFTTLLVGRTFLGLGEGNGTPTCINACHEWFPSDGRRLPTAVMMFGAIVGSLLSAPALSAIIARYGWHSAFAACAMAGGAILLLWLALSRDGPYAGLAAKRARRAAGGSAADAMRLLHDRSVYGSFALGFSADWVTAFTLTWLPTFCVKALGFSLVQTGWLLGASYLAQGLLMLGISGLSQRLIRAGLSTRIASSGLNAACLIVGAACLATAALGGNAYERLALVTFGVGLPISTFSLNPTLMGELFPARHRNRLVHMLLSAGTLGAILGPWLTGRLLGDVAHVGWSRPLLVNSLVLVVGAVLALLLIHPEQSAQRLRALDEQSLPPDST